MNTWQKVGRFFVTPAGVGLVLALGLVFIPGLWEGILGRVDRALETAHNYFLSWAHRHGGDLITGFLLVIGGLWLWRKGAAPKGKG